MKICVYSRNEGEVTGCWWIRIREPLKEFIKNGHQIFFTDGVTPVPWDGWDIVLFNNLLGGVELMKDGKKVGEITLEETLKKFKEGGAKIVYDCDDAMDVHPSHTEKIKNYEENLPSFQVMINHADLITVTTEELKKYIGQYTKVPIKVLPNSIDPSEFGERGESDKVKIIYAGSTSHVKDIELAYPAIERMKEKHGIYYEQLGFQHKFCKWKKPVSVGQYYGALASMNANIGICPLEEGEFNKNKSPLKFLEYSQLDMAVLASNRLPYKGVMKREWLCNDDEWDAKLEKLITDEDYREKVAKEQKKFVQKHFDIRENWKMWEEAYMEILQDHTSVQNFIPIRFHRIDSLITPASRRLEGTSKLLEGEKWCVSFGTALGLYRDKDFIPEDTDIDFNIYNPTNPDEIIETFKQYMTFIRLVTRNGKKYQAAFQCADGLIVDLCFFYQDGKDWTSYCEGGFWKTNGKVKKLKTKYGMIPFPDPIEEYLKESYGDNWTTPISGDKAAKQ